MLIFSFLRKMFLQHLRWSVLDSMEMYCGVTHVPFINFTVSRSRQDVEWIKGPKYQRFGLICFLGDYPFLKKHFRTFLSSYCLAFNVLVFEILPTISNLRVLSIQNQVCFTAVFFSIHHNEVITTIPN